MGEIKAKHDWGLFLFEGDEWLSGFIAFVGICSLIQVEFWALWLRLSFAKQLGFYKIINEIDSKTITILLVHNL